MSEPNTQNYAREKTRLQTWHKYVPHEDVPAYEAIGWTSSTALKDTHHGDHATLMCWEHNTEPPNE
jgi:hypothetical protein